MPAIAGIAGASRAPGCETTGKSDANMTEHWRTGRCARRVAWWLRCPMPRVPRLTSDVSRFTQDVFHSTSHRPAARVTRGLASSSFRMHPTCRRRPQKVQHDGAPIQPAGRFAGASSVSGVVAAWPVSQPRFGHFPLRSAAAASRVSRERAERAERSVSSARTDMGDLPAARARTKRFAHALHARDRSEQPRGAAQREPAGGDDRPGPHLSQSDRSPWTRRSQRSPRSSLPPQAPIPGVCHAREYAGGLQARPSDSYLELVKLKLCAGQLRQLALAGSRDAALISLAVLPHGAVPPSALQPARGRAGTGPELA